MIDVGFHSMREKERRQIQIEFEIQQAGIERKSVEDAASQFGTPIARRKSGNDKK
jgi:hypothetical protein